MTILHIMIKDQSFLRQKINRNLRCSHGYTNCVRHTDSITWVSIDSWEMLLSEFSHAERISACHRKTICNKFEQSNMRGDILNAGDNVDDQENFGFTESFFKIAPTNIDEYINMYITEYATREYETPEKYRDQ